MTQAINNHRNSLEELACAIDWSEGEFSFILALCNSTSLQQQIILSLETACSLQIQQMVLDQSVGTLFQTIQSEISQAPPQALMVVGLESVNNLEKLLVGANQIREEFREHYPFPLVVWVTDQVLSKFIRLAPDFYSWATTVHFAIATEDLIHFIQQTAEQIITQILKDGATRFLDNTALNREIGHSRRTEIESAYKELASRGIRLDPELEANLEFILGRTADCCSDLPRHHYERSLAIWEEDINSKFKIQNSKLSIPNPQFPIPKQQRTNNKQPKTKDNSQFPIPDSQFSILNSQFSILNSLGCLLYCLGTWWRNYAMQNRAEYLSACERAKAYFGECIEVFEQGPQPELVAKFINALGDILERLQHWEELEVVGKKALALHQTYANPFRQARAYGFLAEVALAKSVWSEAEDFAQAALAISDSTIIDALLPASSEINSSLEWVRWFNQSSYLFALARAQKGLVKSNESRKNLETALHKTYPHFEPELYLGILKELRACYFQQGQYLTAFEFKQKQRSIEQQFGFQAFIGAGRLQPSQQVTNLIPTDAKPAGNIAPEIAASGRQQDIKRLVERIGRPDYKLTVIYGQSGVGKSSIVQAGLIPALKKQTIGTRDVVPIGLQVYTHWLTELAKAVSGSLAEVGNLTVDAATLSSTTAIIEQLRKNYKNNLLTVLIFDQFEEFFFVCQDPTQRLDLYDFLRQCFNIPYLKIIFSLREDYLHYLLDFDRLTNLDIINNNILDKHIIYYLGNFSTAEAQSVVESLTKKTQFSLEPALIEQLVQDLAGELGEVRPIELQVVGAQLQAEKITTLAQYQEYGTKEELVKGYLTQVIKDCGPENEEFARLLLYLLTDEQNTRPLKTRADLTRDLQLLKGNLGAVSDQLDLVLKIFVASGLVFLVPETQGDRYQLVHDYLVTFVRQQKTAELIEELQEAEKQRKLSEAQRRLSEQKLNRFLKRALLASVAAVGIMTVLALASVELALQWREEVDLASQARRKAQNVQEDQIRALSRFSDTLRDNSAQEFDALVEAIRAGKQLKEHRAQPVVRSQVIAALRRAVYDVRERNRLSGHSEGVISASFSPDGQMIATASKDGTVKLWNLFGEELQTFNAHQEQVTEVRFNRDSYTLATTSEDGTVKLWKIDQRIGNRESGIGNWESGIGNRELGIGNGLQPQLLHTLVNHRDGVNTVSFSSNGKLVTGSRDWYAKLWSQEGRFIKTLTGHGMWVTSVSFSHDNQTIATASLDRTAKLWTGNGEYLTTLDGHEAGLTSVSFSPDGQIATGSEDRTIRLWSQRGQFLQTLKGHYDTVTSVSFSPNGQELASGSKDKTVELWSQE
ncbi:MAG: sugar-binding protein, partial [Symploca sp. SIO1A3]|nr:sugar-binding protein [Symploca sp. SIO1A3]